MNEFVSTDVDAIMERMTARYEQITGRTLLPADPERLILAWVANIIVQERVYQNYCASQNIPSYAEGDNLDALGEWIYDVVRKGPQSAKCIVRITLSEAQEFAVAIPAGTRVTDTQHTLYWATTEDTAVPAHEEYVDVMVECETPGEIGNGYTPGQINTLVDPSNVQYFGCVVNTTISDGGADTETDAEYLAQMRNRLNAFSTAGPEQAYVYWAKSVSDDIADVKAIRPITVEVLQEVPLYGPPTLPDSNKYGFVGAENVVTETIEVYGALPNISQILIAGTDYTVSYEDNLITVTILSTGAGSNLEKIRVAFQQYHRYQVDIYALMNDGTAASSTIKTLIAAACNAASVRPLTDEVFVKDPASSQYDINLTYYVGADAEQSLAEIQTAVAEAVDKYVEWQSAKLGRDVNPSMLYSFLMATGIKRVVLTSPTYMTLNNGSNGFPPEIALLRNRTVTFGGIEND